MWRATPPANLCQRMSHSRIPPQFKLIGTSAKRLDTPSKVNGSAVYGMDIMVPGMRIGTLAITPVKGGKLVSMDEAAARAVPGVRDVIRAGDEAVAVIGDHMWAAKQGLQALTPGLGPWPERQGDHRISGRLDGSSLAKARRDRQAEG